MKKLLSLFGTVIIFGSGFSSLVSCANSSKDTTNTSLEINDFYWTAGFSGNNSIWLEQTSALNKNLNSNNINVVGQKYKFKNFDFNSVANLYTTYAQEWFKQNSLTETSDVTKETQTNQNIVDGAAVGRSAFIIGYIENQRNENAVTNSIKNKMWDSIFTTASIAANYDFINYFYLQAPNSGATSEFIADQNGDIVVNLNVYFLIASKNSDNKVQIDKISSEILPFYFKVPTV